MSEHIEFFRNVDVTWNKKTGVLSVNDDKGIQLAMVYVTEED